MDRAGLRVPSAATGRRWRPWYRSPSHSTLTITNRTVPKAGLAPNLLLWIVRSHGGYGYRMDSVQTAAPVSAFR